MSNSFTVNTYSPSDVTLIIAGYRVTGWERISITRTVKGFTTIRGIRGKNTRVDSRDTSATLSFPLLQTCQSNEVLSYIHELDLQEKTGRLTITLKDLSGKTVFSSDEGYITGYPPVVFSGGFEYRVWEVFLQTTGTYNITGNSKPTTSVFDNILNRISDTF